MHIRSRWREVSRLHAHAVRDRGQPRKMSNHHRHEKPREYQRGAAPSGQTNRHLALPPEAGRQNQTNDPTPKKVDKVYLGRHLRTKFQHFEATSHHPRS